MDVLTDGWELRGCLGDTWRWLSGPGRPEGEPGWLPARVPGSVLDDLHEAGVVPDPYHGTNTLLSEWVPQRTWLYRRTLTVPPRGPGGRVLLHFDGVDHEATVLVDGAWAAHHTGMYTPFTCDITDRVPPGGGSVLLAVAVHPAPAGEPQVGRTDRVRTHKSRMGYGWDFCPRMVHQGVWKPVRMEVAGPARLAGTTVAATLSDDHAHGTVDVTARVDATAPGSVHVTVRDPEQLLVARTEVRHPAGAQEVPARLDVPEPRLWWPNGHGDRPLYAVTVELRDGTGKTVGRAERHCGFRRIALRPNPGAPADALPYTLEVNGRPLYAKGWNWVPHDALYGAARPGRLQHLLTLAAAAHVTLLRVWGGGLIESEEFYAACDRLGLLVWQEFSLSSSGIDSVPSEDPVYLAHMEDEARHIVPALRHHPALALWGPGNELHDTAAGRPLSQADSAVIAVLARVVAELDPGRAWLPGSPSGRAFLNRLDVIHADPDGQHDVHGPWEHQGHGLHQELYDAGTCLLHSEFGVEGMANRRTWNAVVPEDRQWPTGRDNPVMEHLGAWWNNTPLVRAAFGGRPGTWTACAAPASTSSTTGCATPSRPTSAAPRAAAVPCHGSSTSPSPTPGAPPPSTTAATPNPPTTECAAPTGPTTCAPPSPPRSGTAAPCSPPPPMPGAPSGAPPAPHPPAQSWPASSPWTGRRSAPATARSAFPSPTSPARCSYSTWNYATTTERCWPPTATCTAPPPTWARCSTSHRPGSAPSPNPASPPCD
ncbi:glycoside hydrolase family 2 TIM barrel-domain containing protein [Streptomyces sp. ME01-24h]|nr:glycoside hydrolase family 2 TIM barrel-domain containing protein [Streptomyces sp. ME01-24h]